MSNQEIYIAGIKSNTNQISGRAFHDALVNLVRSEAAMGEVSLKSLVPKRSFDLFRAVGHKGPFDSGFDVTAAVGIPEIHKKDESDPYSAKYPIFVDKGTDLFHAKTKQFMYIPASRGYPGFLKESQGQKGKEFMAATYSVMKSMLRINGEKFRAEVTSKLNVDKELV